MLDSGIKKLGFQKPIVGVHIRRTDKVGTEASLHTVDEYMRGVEDYYLQLEMVQKVDKRRVFLASDDPKVSKINLIVFHVNFKYVCLTGD